MTRLVRYFPFLSYTSCTRWRTWLRHCATSRKFAGSIHDGVIRIFHWHNPSGRTMALGLTQPLTEMSTSKGGRCVGLTTLPLHVPIALKSWSLNLLEPSRPVQACNGIVLPFPIYLALFFSSHFGHSSRPFKRGYLNEFRFVLGAAFESWYATPCGCPDVSYERSETQNTCSCRLPWR